MEIITDLVSNYKESMEGLHVVAKVLVTVVLALALLAVSTAIVNLFI